MDPKITKKNAASIGSITTRLATNVTTYCSTSCGSIGDEKPAQASPQSVGRPRIRLRK